MPNTNSKIAIGTLDTNHKCQWADRRQEGGQVFSQSNRGELLNNGCLCAPDKGQAEGVFAVLLDARCLS